MSKASGCCLPAGWRKRRPRLGPRRRASRRSSGATRRCDEKKDVGWSSSQQVDRTFLHISGTGAAVCSAAVLQQASERTLPTAVSAPQAAAREAERVRQEREVQRKEYEAQQVGRRMQTGSTACSVGAGSACRCTRSELWPFRPAFGLMPLRMCSAQPAAAHVQHRTSC